MALYNPNSDTIPSSGSPDRLRVFVMVMALLSALGQLASNIYLPSLPAVAREFGAEASSTALTYTLYLAAFAVAQLVYGPLADRFGRRPLLLAGVALFALASAACALVGTIELLIVARIFQAIGAAAGIVMARAMVRDVFSGTELARVLAIMTIIFALAPGLSPLVGGILQDNFGWRAIFAVVSVVGLVSVIASFFHAPETLEKQAGQLSVAGVAHSYRAVLADEIFRRYALATSFVTGAMSAYFVGSPSVFIDHLGVSATEYGFYPPLAITGFIIGAITTRRLVGKASMSAIAAGGMVVLILGSAMMLLFPLLGLVHKHAINASIIVYVSGLGVFMPTAVALALERCPNRAGSAAALLGFLQMSTGALATGIVGVAQASLPILSFPIVMVAATSTAAAILLAASIPQISIGKHGRETG